MNATAAGFDTGAAEQETCDALWAIAGTDAHDALRWVVPLLQDRRPRVRRFALLAVKGLHPLAGLPAVDGVKGAVPPPTVEPGMRTWLVPRATFVAALTALLDSGSCNEAQLASSLARLPGEHDIVRRLLESHAAAETCDSYVSQWLVRARVPRQLIVALTYRCNRACPYCYAYESQDEIAGDINVASVERTLDWGAKQGVTLVSFTGGEPTCHPHFARLVEAVAARGMRLYLNTNGLFGRRVLDALASPELVDVGFHLSDPELHRPSELPAIARNLDALRERGVDVFVRYTLFRAGDGALPWLMEFCRAHGVFHLNLALGFPGRKAKNDYLPSDRYAEMKPVLLRALTLAAEHGIRVRASKPIPLCLFTPAEFAHFQRFHRLTSTCSVHDRDGVHNLVVNPDLSTYPCVGLPFRGPNLLESEFYAPQTAHCRGQIKRALKIVQAGCAACSLLPLGVCQASCLGHCNHFESAPVEGSP